MKGIMRFVKRGKLNPRYICSYQILRKIGQVAYTLELPSELASVHLVFHVSILQKCVGDLPLIVPIEDIEILENLSCEEIPVAVLDRQARKLRTK